MFTHKINKLPFVGVLLRCGHTDDIRCYVPTQPFFVHRTHLPEPNGSQMTIRLAVSMQIAYKNPYGGTHDTMTRLNGCVTVNYRSVSSYTHNEATSGSNGGRQ